MIEILNGYNFKRNFDNTVFVELSSIAHVLGVQPYLIKEHYFICVADRCFSEGEIHIEEIENGSINVYIPCKSFEYLIESLKYENVAITDYDKEKAARLMLDKHIQTQNIVSECFNRDVYDYSDPIRKINPNLPDISKSVTTNSED